MSPPLAGAQKLLRDPHLVPVYRAKANTVPTRRGLELRWHWGKAELAFGKLLGGYHSATGFEFQLQLLQRLLVFLASSRRPGP